ncbi:transcriptional regulator LldR [Xanthobacter sp. TB0136]|uniref:transcriptional regulator LldR n=1 Tax=Xanthobacter sp. TB0136 TaxID=3459177 RepID=UPI00403A4790
MKPRNARLADELAEQLEVMIHARGIKPGERLPAERKLALEMQVSRSSLREAIQKLASRGLLISRPGGGTYVQDVTTNWTESAIVDPLSTLFRDNPEYRFDVLEIRDALEGAAAYHAAIRATEEDKRNLLEQFESMISLHGSPHPMDEAHADAAFHLAIAAASHNLVLYQIMRGLFDLLQANISHNLEKLYTLPRVFEPLSEQHRELMDAIIAGEPERARRAACIHIDFVRSSLKTIDEDEARKARAFRLPPAKVSQP